MRWMLRRIFIKISSRWKHLVLSGWPCLLGIASDAAGKQSLYRAWHLPFLWHQRPPMRHGKNHDWKRQCCSAFITRGLSSDARRHEQEQNKLDVSTWFVFEIRAHAVIRKATWSRGLSGRYLWYFSVAVQRVFIETWLPEVEALGVLVKTNLLGNSILMCAFLENHFFLS